MARAKVEQVLLVQPYELRREYITRYLPSQIETLGNSECNFASRSPCVILFHRNCYSLSEKDFGFAEPALRTLQMHCPTPCPLPVAQAQRGGGVERRGEGGRLRRPPSPLLPSPPSPCFAWKGVVHRRMHPPRRRKRSTGLNHVLRTNDVFFKVVHSSQPPPRRTKNAFVSFRALSRSRAAVGGHPSAVVFSTEAK